ncbi:uncharacterized protein LOC113226693 [Hyposmocoma kahamanoa]|uniref:uncharacterized protein LOC113226693 n=1 Tax=Hyposmocoma kahamanoa TaxID=1477025 RepID=UPI000E6D61B1|nr:uncharacterized protein LOC113226693 [Hyposmocoma kahamanoa]
MTQDSPFEARKMPFAFKKKGKRREVPMDIILRAIEEVSKGSKIKTTANKYNIPRSNLQRYLKQEFVKDNASRFVSSQIFTTEEEEKLVDYMMVSSKLHYGLTKLQARKLAYDYAVATKKTNIPDNWIKNEIASKDWIRGFLRRQSQLSIRTTEATSLSRATSFNKTNVGDFFTNLRAVYERHQFGPESIYNIDETGLTTVQRTRRVIAPKGTKQVGQATSAERGSLVTVCCGVNALGNFVPPYFIFPRVHFKSYMLHDAPIGSDGSTHPSGWMTSSNFIKYMHHFAKHVKPSPTSPVLLLLDNHESHISVEVLNFCKDVGIILMTFPPHCSHKLQPLDLTVYGPLKNYYNNALTDWMVCNAGKTVTIYDVPKLAALAIPQAFKQQSIQKGFEKSGIWPFNSNIFTDDDFLCSSITDRYLPGTENISTIQSTPNRVPSELSTGDIQSGSDSENLNIMVVSSPSQLESFTREHIEEVAETITPESVRPYPKAGPRLSSIKRKKGKTRILTDTPEKRLIEIAEQEKQRKNKAKEERQFKKNLKNTEKKKIPKLPVELTSKRVVEKEMISSDSDMENVFIATSSEGSFVIETSEEELDEDDIDSRLSKDVENLITNPAPLDQWDNWIRVEMIKRFSTTSPEGEELGDRKPSVCLRHLRSLSGNLTDEAILRELFLQRLPRQF